MTIHNAPKTLAVVVDSKVIITESDGLNLTLLNIILSVHNKISTSNLSKEITKMINTPKSHNAHKITVHNKIFF